MMDEPQLEGKRIALLATDGFEDSELEHPMGMVQDAGAEVVVVSLSLNDITGKNGTKVEVDESISDVDADDFDGLLLPGGVANPDTLRIDSRAVDFVKAFFEQHKPVAAICHAPWVLVEADVVDGRRLTSWPSLRTDLENAGAIWVDEQVVVDHGLVTSRSPDDMPAFCKKAIEEFAEGPHEDQIV